MLTKNPAISVVIPIYNQEKYVRKCIRSVLSQSFQDFEIIIVNDGSKDNSLKACQRYAKKDSRITIIDKQNEGPALARKDGFLKAEGEYICYIDGDDYIVPHALELLYQLALEKQVDMVVGDFDIVYDNWGFLKKGRGFNVSDRIIPPQRCCALSRWSQLYSSRLVGCPFMGENHSSFMHFKSHE